MRLATSIFLLTGLSLSTAALPTQAYAGNGQSYTVELNKTEILRLPGPASSIIVGNPNIADVTVQSTDMLFVVGRGFGETNLIILDANGNTMMDTDLQVVNSLPSHGVRVYNGKSRETYSCIPYCGPSPVLGDDTGFIRANTSKAEDINPLSALGSLLTSLGDQGQSGTDSFEPAGAPPPQSNRGPS